MNFCIRQSLNTILLKKKKKKKKDCQEPILLEMLGQKKLHKYLNLCTVGQNEFEVRQPSILVITFHLFIILLRMVGEIGLS